MLQHPSINPIKPIKPITCAVAHRAPLLLRAPLVIHLACRLVVLHRGDSNGGKGRGGREVASVMSVTCDRPCHQKFCCFIASSQPGVLESTNPPNKTKQNQTKTTGGGTKTPAILFACRNTRSLLPQRLQTLNHQILKKHTGGGGKR